MTTTTGSAIHYDPYDREILADPYPAFRRLRDDAPVYYNEEHDFWALSRFADVEAALKERRIFSSKKGVILEMIKADFEMPPGTLIHDEPPLHTAHRQMLSRVFTPKAMSSIEPQVREFCAQRLDELRDRDSFDFVREFAQYIPMRVFGMLLGIPDEAQERVREHVEQGIDGGEQEYGDDFLMDGFYDEFVDYRAKHPGDDLITRLITTEFEDELGVRRTLTRAESLMYLAVIAGAGNHTTNRLIGWLAKILADHPDARAELRADRALIPNAVEETLRFEPSSTQIARFVTEDVELHGQTVPEGSAMLLLAGSANRDERQFDDPDTYDIHRKLGHHLTFGYGPHFCLGASLARLEGRVALEEMLDRLPDWETDLDAAQLGNSPGVRGYASLPVRLA
jgi:cytochrome P450